MRRLPEGLRGRLLPLLGMIGVVGVATADTGETGEAGDSGSAPGDPSFGVCLDTAWGAACPAADDVLDVLVADWEAREAARREASGGFGTWCELQSVASGPVALAGRYCCYEVVAECSTAVGCGCGGRRLATAKGRVLAGVGPVGRAPVGAPRPPPVARAILASWWAQLGAAEAASVPSFRRFVAELERFGAPPSLRKRARLAAADEARHARRFLALSGRCLGARVVARAPAVPPPAVDLPAFAAATARDAAVEELRSAVVLGAMVARARVNPVRRAVEAVLTDEVGHVALAWEAVAWAVRAGGAGVREAVAGALHAARDPVADWPTHPVLAAWGCPGRPAIVGAVARADTLVAGLAEVVLA